MGSVVSGGECVVVVSVWWGVCGGGGAGECVWLMFGECIVCGGDMWWWCMMGELVIWPVSYLACLTSTPTLWVTLEQLLLLFDWTIDDYNLD